jgi:hypothetical protein
MEQRLERLEVGAEVLEEELLVTGLEQRLRYHEYALRMNVAPSWKPTFASIAASSSTP